MGSKTLTIVGLGLIGGCYAKTLREEFDTIYGIDLDDLALAYAKRENVINEGYKKAKIPISKSDIVVICLYPDLLLKFIEENKENFRPGTIITDAIGIKGDTIEKVLDMLPKGVDFVGAHPMAGREVQGVWNSDKKIFRGANFIITPHPKNNEESLNRVEEMAVKMGFKSVTRVTPK